MLNKGQETALQQMLWFINSDDKFFLLEGSAGTGKTYTISAFIAEVSKNQRLWIALTAPTNKAVKVAAMASSQWRNHNIDYMTTYQLLGLSMDINEEGDKVLVEGRQSSVSEYDLVFIDEASMIAENLWELLQKVTKRYPRIKIIFVGDHAQLNPVNETESKVFAEIANKARLTEVMRTGSDNPVMSAICACREKVYNHDHPLLTKSSFNPDRTHGFWSLPSNVWLGNMIKSFSSEKYQNNPDYTRAIAWTNRRVNELNGIIRTALYETNIPYVVGERLIAKDAICEPDGSIKISTNTEMIVTRAEFRDKLLSASESESVARFNPIAFDTWYLEVQTDTGDVHYLDVLNNSSLKAYQKATEELAKTAMSVPRKDAKEEWAKYWNFKNQFANVNYAYALTSHKSQGSTFNNVFVDQANICLNPNLVERYRSLYVSYSRTSERLFVKV